MTNRCLCYAVDVPYLFPAVASAVHLRQILPVSEADVLVFCIDMSDAVRRDFGPACDAAGVQLLNLARRDLDGLSGLYASLFLDRYLPDAYEHVAFVDNDVQFWRSPSALFHLDVPKGHFAAVADPMVFMLDQPGRHSAKLTSYMDGLGLRNELGRRYFNTGLLRLNRGGWPEICAEALRFLRTQPESCQFADQSALNAASGGAHSLLSLRWNFPIFLRNCGVEDEIAPAMYHFMAQPKPWHGGFRPWDERFTEPYATLLTAHPVLQDYAQRMSGIRRTRYLLQQSAKWAGEAVTWRFSARRQRILAYEQQTFVGALDGR
jgi:hypothetical protein